MLKQLGIVSVLLMWAGTYALLKRHLPDLGKTISKHASKSVRYHVAYGLLELTVVSLFSLFMFGWFIPTSQLGLGYTIAAIVGLAGTIIAAVIPDREGWLSRIHGFSAYSMAMSLLAMNLFLATNHHINLLTQIVLYISLAYMIIGTTIAVVRPQIYRRNALKLQIIYFLAFQIPVLLAVYF